MSDQGIPGLLSGSETPYPFLNFSEQDVTYEMFLTQYIQQLFQDNIPNEIVPKDHIIVGRFHPDVLLSPAIHIFDGQERFTPLDSCLYRITTPISIVVSSSVAEQQQQQNYTEEPGYQVIRNIIGRRSIVNGFVRIEQGTVLYTLLKDRQLGGVLEHLIPTTLPINYDSIATDTSFVATATITLNLTQIMEGIT